MRLLVIFILLFVSKLSATDLNQMFATFVAPVMEPKVSSNFGKRKHPIWKYHKHHSGIDLKVPTGTPIRALKAGTVVFADWYAGYGKLITVQHADGLVSMYGHCSDIKVKIGQQLKAGEIIGLVGSTGHSTGSHLHLELRKDGKALNPNAVLPSLNAKAKG